MFDTFFWETYILKSYKFSGPTSPFVRYNSNLCINMNINSNNERKYDSDWSIQIGVTIGCVVT